MLLERLFHQHSANIYRTQNIDFLGIDQDLCKRFMKYITVQYNPGVLCPMDKEGGLLIPGPYWKFKLNYSLVASPLRDLSFCVEVSPLPGKSTQIYLPRNVVCKRFMKYITILKSIHYYAAINKGSSCKINCIS